MRCLTFLFLSWSIPVVLILILDYFRAPSGITMKELFTGWDDEKSLISCPGTFIPFVNFIVLFAVFIYSCIIFSKQLLNNPRIQSILNKRIK